MKNSIIITFLLCFFILFTANTLFGKSVLLNGTWQFGENRDYSDSMDIPGIATNPARMNDAPLWFKKEIRLPDGDWTHATLILKGALFSPAVYINNVKISQQNGGMAPTYFPLQHSAIKPNQKVTLEISLESLRDISESDASYVPTANHWRSNISSLIWDDVILKTHGEFRISRIIPFTDIQNDRVKVAWELERYTKNLNTPDQIVCEILDQKGIPVVQNQKTIHSLSGHIKVPFDGKCKLWSPENPNLYKLKLTLKSSQRVIDSEVIAYGVKTFRTDALGFKLNDNPYKVRAGTVVWHRWIRDPEAKYIAFDEEWFRHNVVQRLKDHGANTLRFHLGNPPEKLLDLCDKYGLLVQYEWSFFHGMPASKESLLEQWKNWFDLGMRHPSVALIHPYNETSGKELDIAWSALDQLVADYPPLVLEERDVLHVHKYWWSMFENVGLYYDTASEFPKPIMVDEFGGNYLDGYGNPGGYKTLKGSYLRYCGRNQTPATRMYHHTISNSRIAEYWRRIGAAGFSPFCILGSREDGNHWYLGQLKNGLPKDVWNALTAAYSPVSVSLEIWDRNFTPGQNVQIPLYVFNDSDETAYMDVTIFIETESGKRLGEILIHEKLPAFQNKIRNISLKLPEKQGRFTFKAILLNPPETVKYSVISEWDFRILKEVVPSNIQNAIIGIQRDELELISFLESNHISIVDIDNEEADIILGSAKTWDKLVSSAEKRKDLYQSVQSGKSLVLLNIGPHYLGQGYSEDPNIRYGFIQSGSKIKEPEVKSLELFGGVKLKFTTIAEPESHIHPAKGHINLWANLEQDYTWLWNGLRGGIIAPAVDMEFSGLSAEGILAQWTSRGADKNMFKEKEYFAYDLQGFYAFSSKRNDNNVKQKLRDRVQFLVDDAPALAPSINADAEIIMIDLINKFNRSSSAKAKKFTPLINCGYNLTRTPVVKIDFDEHQGSAILSQLVTEGRLVKGFGESGLYGKRYDPVAAQLVLNLLNKVLKN